MQAYAVKDRIDYSRESDKKCGSEVNLFDVLPSSDEYRSLKETFAVQVSRIIVQYLPFFKEDFNGLVLRHIPHKYSKEMAKKSEIVRNNPLFETRGMMHF